MAKTVKNEKNTWWQLFKTGTHTSAAGKEFKADDKALDEIITATKNRKYANDEIPICIGHRKDDSPKWGAFKKDSFQKTGDFLQGKYEYLVTEFAEAIERKMFDKVSLALYPDKAIKHIAVLGVTAPAIKDLGTIELAANDEAAEEYEFSEVEISPWWFSGMVGLMRSVKNFLISKFTLEEVEKIIPESTITNLAEPPRVWTKEKNYFNENKNEGENMSVKTTEEVTQDFQEKLNAADEKAKKLQADLDKAQADLLTKEIDEFCESGEMKNRITPALRPHVAKIYADLAANNTEFEFSEGEGDEKKTVKTTRLESFKKILAAIPAMEFSEFAKKDKAGSQAEEPQDFREGKRMAEAANANR
jgi:hypothetical protein